MGAIKVLREYSTVGSASLMTDSTDRLASTVINLVLPDKVYNGMPKGQQQLFRQNLIFMNLPVIQLFKST